MIKKISSIFVFLAGVLIMTFSQEVKGFSFSTNSIISLKDLNFNEKALYNRFENDFQITALNQFEKELIFFKVRYNENYKYITDLYINDLLVFSLETKFPKSVTFQKIIDHSLYFSFSSDSFDLYVLDLNNPENIKVIKNEIGFLTNFWKSLYNDIFIFAIEMDMNIEYGFVIIEENRLIRIDEEIGKVLDCNGEVLVEQNKRGFISMKNQTSSIFEKKISLSKKESIYSAFILNNNSIIIGIVKETNDIIGNFLFEPTGSNKGKLKHYRYIKLIYENNKIKLQPVFFLNNRYRLVNVLY
jgi:hypothetical protein